MPSIHYYTDILLEASVRFGLHLGESHWVRKVFFLYVCYTVDSDSERGDALRRRYNSEYMDLLVKERGGLSLHLEEFHWVRVRLSVCLLHGW